MHLRDIAAAATVLLTACQPTYDCPDNAIRFRNDGPRVTIVSPAEEDQLTTSSDVMIRFLVEDLESGMDELTARIRIGEEFADNALPDDSGYVEVDWRTPDTPGPVEVTASVRDSDGETEMDVRVFWVADVAP